VGHFQVGEVGQKYVSVDNLSPLASQAEFQSAVNRIAHQLERNLPVVCGLGKSCLILGVYPELFELTLSLFYGFKMRKNPESTNYRYSG
jgi:hypothetical protein